MRKTAEGRTGTIPSRAFGTNGNSCSQLAIKVQNHMTSKAKSNFLSTSKHLSLSSLTLLSLFLLHTQNVHYYRMSAILQNRFSVSFLEQFQLLSGFLVYRRNVSDFFQDAREDCLTTLKHM